MRTNGPNGAARKRKTAAAGTASDRARRKLAAWGWDKPSIEQYIEGFSETLLDMLFPKQRRGRPRLLSWDDILPSWESIYGADAWRGPLPQRGGRPSQQERNQSLCEGWPLAESQGMTKRAFVKQWYRKRHGREATPDYVPTLERQLTRLLKK